ncbi:MAG: preprotein translocase subunit SecE [Bacteroidota bacterium]|jgi:preprotein translocase subunit SecE
MASITNYIKESFTELTEKVNWPTWEELQESVVIVMIASLFIALVVFVMDFGFTKIMELLYSL